MSERKRVAGKLAYGHSEPPKNLLDYPDPAAELERRLIEIDEALALAVRIKKQRDHYAAVLHRVLREGTADAGQRSANAILDSVLALIARALEEPVA